jgi:2-hydroxycyclohexanecarboxyl-CoA dehydrogenase
VSHVVLRGMAARGFGRVVNIASDAGRVGSSGEAVYSACKGGIIALTKTLARELVGKGVILNTICPGPTDTAILRSFLEGAEGARIAEGLKRAIPMRRFGAGRVPAVGRRRLHDGPDHQRLGRAHHARVTQSSAQS